MTATAMVGGASAFVLPRPNAEKTGVLSYENIYA